MAGLIFEKGQHQKLSAAFFPFRVQGIRVHRGWCLSVDDIIRSHILASTIRTWRGALLFRRILRIIIDGQPGYTLIGMRALFVLLASATLAHSADFSQRF